METSLILIIPAVLAVAALAYLLAEAVSSPPVEGKAPEEDKPCP